MSEMATMRELWECKYVSRAEWNVIEHMRYCSPLFDSPWKACLATWDFELDRWFSQG